MKGVFLLALAAAGFLACSFDYENIDSSKTPDMVFTGTVARRYSDGKETFEITADIMEIYSSEKIWAADTVSFREFSDEGSEENSASAGIMLLDEQNEVYTLGGTVTFYAGEDNLTIKGEDLRWHKRDNFISAPVESKVEITGENIAASGLGFSANTQERSYSFSGRITGMLIPKDEEKTEADLQLELLEEEGADFPWELLQEGGYYLPEEQMEEGVYYLPEELLEE